MMFTCGWTLWGFFIRLIFILILFVEELKNYFIVSRNIYSMTSLVFQVLVYRAHSVPHNRPSELYHTSV